MEINNRTAKKLKKDFPIFKNNKGLIYLDSAAISQRPRSVIRAVDNFARKENANAFRGIYNLAQIATKRYTDAHKIVAKFINANPEEIIFTKNTTESLNMLSYTLPSILKKGRNEIVLTEIEHHSNLIPWQQLAKRNKMKLKFIKVKSDFTIDMDDAKKKITNKTAILSIIHISNVTGTILPVKQLIKLAKQKNAITIIDAAQSASHTKIDVKDLDCDFLAFSSHKIIGPTLGILYGKKSLLEKLPPFMFGGGMINEVSYKDAKWAKLPMKFEPGTPDIAGAIGCAVAVRYIQKIGIQNIYKWETKLLKYALKRLQEIPGIKIYNPSVENSISIVSFNLENAHSHDIASLLNDSKIAIRAGHHCVMPFMKKLGIAGTCRASFCFYNTFEDIDRLTKVLKDINNKFK
ncbi:aminotransferase class V-fold PLP-dependent enzyme [Nanoarchaeota archaeon]